jgi:hypothetical protein
VDRLERREQVSREPLIKTPPKAVGVLPASLLVALVREPVVVRSRSGEFVVYSNEGSGGIPLLVLKADGEGLVPRPPYPNERSLGKRFAAGDVHQARMAVAGALSMAADRAPHQAVETLLAGLRKAAKALPPLGRPRHHPGGPSRSLGNRQPVSGHSVPGGLPGLGKRR